MPVDWTTIVVGSGLSAISTLGGAYFGARAARDLAERAERRKEAIQNLRGLNNAIALVGAELNTAVALKRQFVEPLVSDFLRIQDGHKSHVAKCVAGSEDHELFKFNPDLSSITISAGLISQIKEVLLSRANADGPSIMLFSYLEIASLDARDVFNQRNEILDELRKLPNAEFHVAVESYLGLRRSDGTTDARYPQVVTAIAAVVDDILIFGRELATHLEILADKASKEIGKGSPRAYTISFKKMEELGVYPDATRYDDILTAAGVLRL